MCSSSCLKRVESSGACRKKRVSQLTFVRTIFWPKSMSKPVVLCKIKDQFWPVLQVRPSWPLMPFARVLTDSIDHLVNAAWMISVVWATQIWMEMMEVTLYELEGVFAIPQNLGKRTSFEYSDFVSVKKSSRQFTWVVWAHLNLTGFGSDVSWFCMCSVRTIPANFSRESCLTLQAAKFTRAWTGYQAHDRLGGVHFLQSRWCCSTPVCMCVYVRVDIGTGPEVRRAGLKKRDRPDVYLQHLTCPKKYRTGWCPIRRRLIPKMFVTSRKTISIQYATCHKFCDQAYPDPCSQNCRTRGLVAYKLAQQSKERSKRVLSSFFCTQLTFALLNFFSMVWVVGVCVGSNWKSMWWTDRRVHGWTNGH